MQAADLDWVGREGGGNGRRRGECGVVALVVLERTSIMTREQKIIRAKVGLLELAR